MRKIYTYLMILSIIFWCTSLMAQDEEKPTVDIDSVNIKGFRGVKSIFDKTTNEVIQHYVYFDNGSSLEVIFLDLDLQITKRLPLPLATGDIQEAVFNGETILFYTITNGFDWVGNSGTDRANIQYYTVSLDGEILGQFGSSFVATEDGKTQPYVVPSEIDNGFYLLNPSRNEDVWIPNKGFVGYNVTKVDAQFETQWTKGSFPIKKKEGIMLQTAESGFDRLVIIESKMANWLTNKMTGTELVCLDGNNGDELYRAALFSDAFTSLPSQIDIDIDGNINLGGEYFKGAKTKNVNSTGIFVTKLDPSGQELSVNRSSWKDGIQKQLKRGSFSFSGKNKVLFHDIVSTEDGGFQLIGESFSKKQTLGKNSMLGALANAALSEVAGDDAADAVSGAVDIKNFIIAIVSGRFIGFPDPEETPTILTVQEMMLFDYDENLELTEVRRVEKPYTKVYSYPPYTGTGGLTLAKIMKGYGFFDYSFVSYDEESGKQTMVYNSMMSKRPSMGMVDIEKGSEAVPREFVVKNLKKYGGFDEEAEEVEDGNKDEDGKKLKFSNTGIAQANEGKVVIYYIEKRKKEKTGTLKMFHETLNTGVE